MTADVARASLLAQQFAAAHRWPDGTMEQVGDAVAAWQPAGRAVPIGATYLHIR